VHVPKTSTAIARDLATACDTLTFAAPVTHVYNPLTYAWDAHRTYLRRWGDEPGRMLLLGMNPGPFGMVQTGVPFGEVSMVRDFLGISQGVHPPSDMHPARPIEGFDCPRSEVSGTRLWGWVRDHFGTPDAFFAQFFVWNYCPLAFLEASGRNRTPDKLPADERSELFAHCDRALLLLTKRLKPALVIGVGAFAEARARIALAPCTPAPPCHRILHPSPASPAANRDWGAQVTAQLRAIGVTIPGAR